MMPRNQQSNHEMALLHSSPRNINGVRTLQTDVQQGFQIPPNGSSAHYLCCSALQAGGGRCSSLASCSLQCREAELCAENKVGLASRTNPGLSQRDQTATKCILLRWSHPSCAPCGHPLNPSAPPEGPLVLSPCPSALSVPPAGLSCGPGTGTCPEEVAQRGEGLSPH